MSKLKKKKSKLASKLSSKKDKQDANNPAPYMSKEDAIAKLKEFQKLEQNQEAAILCGKMIESYPEEPLFYFLLGTFMSRLKDYVRASAMLSKAIDLKPDYAEAWNNLGNVFDECRKYEDACKAFQKATEIKPDFIDPWFNLANVLKKTQHGIAAIEVYREVLKRDPNHIRTLYEFPSLAYGYGYFEEAEEVMRRLADLTGDPGMIISYDLLMPMIPPVKEKIPAVRKKYEDALDQYITSDLRVEEPDKKIKRTSFRLAYHGENNCELMKKQAHMHANVSPHLLYTAEHCKDENYYPKSDKKIRIGFVSKFFYSHSVSRCYNKLIEHIGQNENFEVFILSTENVGIRDHVLESILRYTTEVNVPEVLQEGQKTIADLKLDILLYTEIGMDQYSYCLAMARLAPIQGVMAGHPDTTGIPTIDYYFSSSVVEPHDHAQDNYTETLLEFSNIPQYIERPSPPKELKTKSDLGIPEDKNIYACPMKMHKMHPDFDIAMKNILEKDPNGVILLFKDHGNLSNVLLERVRTAIPEDLMERIVMVPWADKEDFKSYLIHSDLIIDPFHFGGGTTNYMILSVGTPIVTWPGNYMAGCGALACYRRMDMMELVAKDWDEYVELAVKVGKDKDYREELKQKILDRCDVIFHTEDVAEEVTQKLLEISKEKNII